jgi:ribonuclease HI
MGVGLVARDSTGKVRASLCNFLPYLTNPAVAEAFATRQGAELLRDMGFQKILLEGDAQVIVQAINYAGVCSARYANIIDDTRTILQSFSS